jgi:glycosyltransferase involved in cell wall biosynthesis
MLDVFDYWVKKYDVEPEFILREPLGSLVAEMKKRGWKYHPVRFTFWSYPKPPVTDEEIYTEYKVNSRAVKKIKKIISKSKPDLVITNTIISPWAAIAAHSLNYPHVWFVREYGDLDHDRKFVLSHEETYKDVGNLSNLVVANSETIARHIEKYVSKNKVTTLYNPFDLKVIDKKAKTKLASPYKHKGSLKLIMTSNISHTKGQLDAVEATGMLNSQGYKTELCLVGKNVDRPYYEQIEDSIKKYHLADMVHLIGHQPNVLALVNLADVGIVASRKEAFGRTTFECIAIGKPVIGANTGATTEMVEE